MIKMILFLNSKPPLNDNEPPMHIFKHLVYGKLFGFTATGGTSGPGGGAPADDAVRPPM